MNWLPETQTAVIPLICGGVIAIVGTVIYSLCKVASSADAHIEILKEELNKEHGSEVQDQNETS